MPIDEKDLVTQALILGLAIDFKSNRKEVSIQIYVTHRQFLTARSGWTIPLSERNFMAYAIWRAKFTLCCTVIGCGVLRVSNVESKEVEGGEERNSHNAILCVRVVY